MTTQAAFQLALTMVLVLGGTLGGFFMLALVSIKMASLNKWYVEINYKGQLDDVLVKPSGSSFIHKNTTYFLPSVARMGKFYPPGLPKILQVRVDHEKFIAGNPNPIDIPELVTDQGVGQYLAQLAESRTSVMKNATEAWNSANASGMSTTEIILAAGIFVAIAAAGVAAYYGYTMSEQVEVIAQAVVGL